MEKAERWIIASENGTSQTGNGGYEASDGCPSHRIGGAGLYLSFWFVLSPCVPTSRKRPHKNIQNSNTLAEH